MTVLDKARKIATNIRNAIYGRDIRELLAQIAELTGNQIDRVNTLIRENPQPDEVVDGRQEFPTLRDNLEDKDRKIEDKVEQSYFDVVLSNILKGSPKGVFTTLASLVSEYPNGAPGVYLVIEDGHVYYWDGQNWKDAGEYQGVQIAAGSVGYNELSPEISGINDYTTETIRENGVLVAIEIKDGAQVISRTELIRDSFGAVNQIRKTIDGNTILSTVNKRADGSVKSISKEVV
jgi:hypothetical protein